MIQNGSARSVIEEFALGVHGNQKETNYASPDKQIVDLVSDNTDKHSILQSRSTQKGSANTVNSLIKSSAVQTSLNKFVTVNKRKHESIETALSEVPLLRNGPPMGRSTESNSSKCPAFPKSSDDCVLDDNSNKIDSAEPRPAKVTGIKSVFGEAGRSILYPCGDRKQNARVEEDASIMFPCMDREKNGAIEKQKTQKRPHDDNSEPTTPICKKSQLVPQNLSDALIPIQSPGVASIDSPVVSSGSMVGFSLQFSFKDLMSRRKQRLSRLGYIRRSSGRINLGSGFTAASLELSQVVNEEGKAKALDAATIELERLFKKEDFKQMKVIGQFNLGFIIGKLDQDLFIVDQHAADEKHNYERLSQTTILNQQPLLRPLKMELAPEEEIVISMHMDTFRKNGFLLEEDVHAASGRRFILKAVPFSKNITFGIADIKELISILSDSHGECAMIGSYRSDSADSVCPPKVRAMLASRACRSSIMIGDSLGRNEMQKILEHLAVLKSPWNCPHGRPTMRHLVDLRTVRKRRGEEEEEEENEEEFGLS